MSGSIYEVVAVLSGWVFNQNPIIRQSVCLNGQTATNFTATSTSSAYEQCVGAITLIRSHRLLQHAALPKNNRVVKLNLQPQLLQLVEPFIEL